MPRCRNGYWGAVGAAVGFGITYLGEDTVRDIGEHVGHAVEKGVDAVKNVADDIGGFVSGLFH